MTFLKIYYFMKEVDHVIVKNLSLILFKCKITMNKVGKIKFLFAS